MWVGVGGGGGEGFTGFHMRLLFWWNRFGSLRGL